MSGSLQFGYDGLAKSHHFCAIDLGLVKGAVWTNPRAEGDVNVEVLGHSRFSGRRPMADELEIIGCLLRPQPRDYGAPRELNATKHHWSRGRGPMPRGIQL